MDGGEVLARFRGLRLELRRNKVGVLEEIFGVILLGCCRDLLEAQRLSAKLGGWCSAGVYYAVMY
jgi:hypothetical protein